MTASLAEVSALCRAYLNITPVCNVTHKNGVGKLRLTLGGLHAAKLVRVLGDLDRLADGFWNPALPESAST